MKKLIFAALFLGSSAFAGTATTWNNAALGFKIIASPQSEIMEICNAGGHCMDFKAIRSVDDRTNLCKQVKGDCTFTMQLVDASYRDGVTKDDFMLDIMYQVVKVKSGHCAMESTNGGMRDITGIYL